MLTRFITLLFIAAMVALVVWQFRAQHALLETHQRHQQDAVAAHESEAQLRCNASALARFQVLHLEGNPSAKHRGHFNLARGQCYILIENSENSLDTDWKHITLYDADGKVFGSYGWHSESDRQPAEIPPYTCDVTLPSGAHQACKTEDDFRSLVGAYMR